MTSEDRTKLLRRAKRSYKLVEVPFPKRATRKRRRPATIIEMPERAPITGPEIEILTYDSVNVYVSIDIGIKHARELLARINAGASFQGDVSDQKQAKLLAKIEEFRTLDETVWRPCPTRFDPSQDVLA
jgi:hypothetical protein